MAKILLVDDREDNLISIESIFEKEGYKFVKAGSGKEALKILLTDYDFALILMDVKMPNLNGFETASLIYERDKLKHIPIVFITAHRYDDDNIFKGYRAGAVDYIYKPINPEILRAKVAVFIELYRKTHQLIRQEQKLIISNKKLENEINERKVSEEKVKALNFELINNINKLETANKDLDRFAFMASHDLQEPLRKIRTYTERLYSKLESQLDDNGKKYFNRIESITSRLQILIKDIMTFSLITIEKSALVMSDMNQIVSEVLADLEVLITEKNAKVTIETMPSLCVNPTLITPLFNNLIHNAIKYCKKDVDPVIRIYCEMDPNNNPRIDTRFCRIFIEDNGIGFEQKYSEQIFEMFKRLHSQNEYEGTGIGLALCKKIVEEHNGYISAHSTLGIGSTFIISLPVKVE